MKEIDVSIERESFPSERAYEAFVNGEQDWGWQYNVDRHIWGYGDDGRDWGNSGEKWVDTPQIIGVADIDGKDGQAILYYDYDSDEFPKSGESDEEWIGIPQMFGVQAAEIKDGRAILVYEDEE
jgi:hypothetical protein